MFQRANGTQSTSYRVGNLGFSCQLLSKGLKDDHDHGHYGNSAPRALSTIIYPHGDPVENCYYHFAEEERLREAMLWLTVGSVSESDFESRQS